MKSSVKSPNDNHMGKKKTLKQEWPSTLASQAFPIELSFAKSISGHLDLNQGPF